MSDMMILSKMVKIDDVDRISNLPESVLVEILSLLPIEDAVATSVLSTKWKFHWRNIHTLRFDDPTRMFNHLNRSKQTRMFNHLNRSEHDHLFAYFVNNVFKFLDTKCIHEFSLTIGWSIRWTLVHHLTNWIDAAVSRNPKVIKFCGYYIDPFDMPYSLFTCNTLEVLCLDCNMNLNVPNMVSLPNLKTLRLEEVIFQCEKSIPNLILGCSSLENLYILILKPYENVNTLTISSPTLRYFSFIQMASEEYKVVINAPNLRFLELDTRSILNLSAESLYLLNEAQINFSFWDCDYDSQFFEVNFKYFQGLHNIKNLSLKGMSLEVLNHLGVMHRFSRLTQLTVHVQRYLLKSFHKLLESLNKLESLTISMFFSGNLESCKSWSEPEEVPICLLSCIKTMSICGIQGAVGELEMVAYMLENAKVLRTMTIKIEVGPIITKKEVIQKIKNFRRGSEKCQLIFS